MVPYVKLMLLVNLYQGETRRVDDSSVQMVDYKSRQQNEMSHRILGRYGHPPIHLLMLVYGSL